MVLINKVIYVLSHWLIGLGFSLIHVSCKPFLTCQELLCKENLF